MDYHGLGNPPASTICPGEHRMRYMWEALVFVGRNRYLGKVEPPWLTVVGYWVREPGLCRRMFIGVCCR